MTTPPNTGGFIEYKRHEDEIREILHVDPMEKLRDVYSDHVPFKGKQRDMYLIGVTDIHLYVAILGHAKRVRLDDITECSTALNELYIVLKTQNTNNIWLYLDTISSRDKLFLYLNTKRDSQDSKQAVESKQMVESKQTIKSHVENLALLEGKVDQEDTPIISTLIKYHGHINSFGGGLIDIYGQNGIGPNVLKTLTDKLNIQRNERFIRIFTFKCDPFKKHPVMNHSNDIVATILTNLRIITYGYTWWFETKASDITNVGNTSILMKEHFIVTVPISNSEVRSFNLGQEIYFEQSSTMIKEHVCIILTTSDGKVKSYEIGQEAWEQFYTQLKEISVDQRKASKCISALRSIIYVIFGLGGSLQTLNLIASLPDATFENIYFIRWMALIAFSNGFFSQWSELDDTRALGKWYTWLISPTYPCNRILFCLNMRPEHHNGSLLMLISVWVVDCAATIYFMVEYSHNIVYLPWLTFATLFIVLASYVKNCLCNRIHTRSR